MNISEIIGENLKRLREERNLSLGQLSAASGVSKVMLSQIEKGASNPSVNTVWKIADAMQVPYTQLLERSVDGGQVISESEIPEQSLDGGSGELRCYYRHTSERNFELFRMKMQSGGTHVSQGHGERTDEYALVIAGKLKITLDDGDHTLYAGDAISFRSSKPHVYANAGEGELSLLIINNYR